jgi:hypothetical protein
MNAQLPKTHVQTQIKINAQILTEDMSAPVIAAGENKRHRKVLIQESPGSKETVIITRMSASALPVGQTLLV